MRNLLGLICVVAFLAGCGGGSDGVMSGPPATVAGMWNTNVTNAGSARLTGCTGDLVAYEGFTVAGIAATAPPCDITQTEVTQDGADFTAEPYFVTCSDGSTAAGATQCMTGR